MVNFFIVTDFRRKQEFISYIINDGSSSVEVDDIVGSSIGLLEGNGNIPKLGLRIFLDGLGIEVDSQDSIESLWSSAVSKVWNLRCSNSIRCNDCLFLLPCDVVL